MDPRILAYLQDSDPNKMDELLSLRRNEKEAAAKQQAIQDVTGGLSRGAAAMGTVGGFTPQSTFRPSAVERPDTLELDRAIAVQGLDPKIKDYLLKKQGIGQEQKDSQEQSPYDKARTDYWNTKTRKLQQSMQPSGASGVSGRGTTGESRSSSPRGSSRITEGQRKLGSQLAFIETGYDDLEKLVNQDFEAGPFDMLSDAAANMEVMGVKPAVSLRNQKIQEWQDSASLAVEGLIKNMSGAASTEAEVNMYKNMLTPLPNETREQKQRKLARIRKIMEAIKSVSGFEQMPEEQRDQIGKQIIERELVGGGVQDQPEAMDQQDVFDPPQVGDRAEDAEGSMREFTGGDPSKEENWRIVN